MRQASQSSTYFAIADYVYSPKLGKVAFSGPATALADDQAKLKELFL